MIRLLPLAFLALLSACTAPRERCLASASQDLRVLDQLIAGTKANLQRGYALRRENVPVTFTNFCTGRFGVGRVCTQTQFVTKSRPVAIDPASEARKLALLKARRASIAQRTRRAIDACAQSTPAHQ